MSADSQAVGKRLARMNEQAGATGRAAKNVFVDKAKKLSGSGARCKEFKYFDSFSPRTLLKKEMYEQVCARWKELGFEGLPPKVSTFESFRGQHIS